MRSNMGTERLVIIAALLSACGPNQATDQGTEESSETGDDSCPELIWSDPDGDLELGALEITSMEQANALPLYTRIDGTLRILSVAGLVDLSFLSCLGEVRGGVSI